MPKNFIFHRDTLWTVYSWIWCNIRSCLRIYIKPWNYWILLSNPSRSKSFLFSNRPFVFDCLCSSSVTTSKPELAQSLLATSLQLGSTYSAANQYIKTSSNGYLFVPLPGPGGNCVPGLVNITTSGTSVCKIIPTA